MGTYTKQRRRRSCKYGKLKRKSGRRRCRKSKKRKSRKKRSKKCKYGKLKRKTKRRRCKKKRKSRRTYKMGPELEKFKNTHINKTIYTDRASDEEINDKISKGHWDVVERGYYMLRNIYHNYDPNYYKEDTDNLSKQFYLDDGKTWYVDVQQVDFAGNVVNPMINPMKLKSFLDLVRPINMDESGIAG